MHLWRPAPKKKAATPGQGTDLPVMVAKEDEGRQNSCSDMALGFVA